MTTSTSTLTTLLIDIANSTINNATKIAEEEPDEPLIVSISIFIAILVGSLIFIFFLMSLCLFGHTIYMKCFKKE
jgi:uncharacterized BrkB/YihY/UPF0761 family membrane protein